MTLNVSNDQLVSVREASRHLGRQVDRLVRGDTDKVVVMHRTRMVAVLITVEEYERLAALAGLDE